MKTEQTERKKLLAKCVFDDTWWNDPEQRNYHLHSCGNPENTGGVANRHSWLDLHSSQTYSCHHENEGMKYRCWSRFEKMAECPMAVVETQPAVRCKRFEKERSHPSAALVPKSEIRARFYELGGLCDSCSNCIW